MDPGRINLMRFCSLVFHIKVVLSRLSRRRCSPCSAAGLVWLVWVLVMWMMALRSIEYLHRSFQTTSAAGFD